MCVCVFVSVSVCVCVCVCVCVSSRCQGCTSQLNQVTLTLSFNSKNQLTQTDAMFMPADAHATEQSYLNQFSKTNQSVEMDTLLIPADADASSYWPIA